MFNFLKSKLPETVNGLPRANWIPPQCFNIIWRAEENILQPFEMLNHYCMYKAGQIRSSFGANISIVRTVLVSTSDNKPLMYAFAIEDDDDYILAQIGFSEIYQVAKTDIVVTNTKFYRVMLPASENQNAVFVVKAGQRPKIKGVIIYCSNGSEQPLAFRGNGNKKAMQWLEKNWFSLS